MKCNIQEPEEQTVARYLGRLNEEIANIIQLQLFWTLNDVIRLAFKVEKQMIQRKNNCFPKERVVSNSSEKRWVIPQNNKDRGLSCFSESSRRCFKCQGFGHIAVECPNPRVITLIEKEINEEPTNEHVEEEEIDREIEVEVSADCGEALVVHQNLNATMLTEDGSWLRHNIFYKRCTIKVKVCKVII